MESALREIAMGNERERQLQSKLLKAKEELKLEREEVHIYGFYSSLKCKLSYKFLTLYTPYFLVCVVVQIFLVFWLLPRGHNLTFTVESL